MPKVLVQRHERAPELGVQPAQQRRLAGLTRTVDDGHPEVRTHSSTSVPTCRLTNWVECFASVAGQL